MFVRHRATLIAVASCLACGVAASTATAATPALTTASQVEQYLAGAGATQAAELARLALLPPDAARRAISLLGVTYEEHSYTTTAAGSVPDLRDLSSVTDPLLGPLTCTDNSTSQGDPDDPGSTAPGAEACAGGPSIEVGDPHLGAKEGDPAQSIPIYPAISTTDVPGIPNGDLYTNTVGGLLNRLLPPTAVQPSVLAAVSPATACPTHYDILTAKTAGLLIHLDLFDSKLIVTWCYGGGHVTSLKSVRHDYKVYKTGGFEGWDLKSVSDPNSNTSSGGGNYGVGLTFHWRACLGVCYVSKDPRLRTYVYANGDYTDKNQP